MPPENMEHSEELIAEARNLGWVPKEEFKGNPERWTDAAEFVETGLKITPILRANNKRLQEDLLHTKNEMGTLKAELANAQTAISDLVKANTVATRRAAEAAKVSLKERIKEAREENDVDQEIELREQLDEVNAALKEPEKPAPKDPPTTKAGETTVSPDFLAWQSEVAPWYNGNSPEDKRRTKLAGRIAEDLMDEGTTLKGRAFLDEVTRLLEEQEESSSTPQRRTSKVEGSNPSARLRGGAKSWNDLPAEAKEAAMGFEGSLVGPNKAYKTVDAWRAQYTKDYFSDEG